MTTQQGRVDRRSVHEASLLLRQILTLNHEVERQLGRELAVNATDLDAMQHLMQSGPLSPTEIAHRLGISTAAATMAVDRLVKVGHVTRKAHPTDRRKLLVVPEDQSVARAMASLMPMIRDTDALMDSFDAREQSAITAYLSGTVDILAQRLADAEESESVAVR